MFARKHSCKLDRSDESFDQGNHRLIFHCRDPLGGCREVLMDQVLVRG